MLHSAVGVETMPDSLTRETIGQTVLRLRDEPVVHKQPETWVPTPPVVTAMEQLMELVGEVRSPEGGWPADRPATAANLTPYVLDEAYDLLMALQQSHQPEQQAPWQPFHSLQQLLQRRLLVMDAIPHLLWTLARSSPQAMKLLAGMRAEVFQPGQTWDRGVLRLVALLELRTPHLHWTLDLATLDPPPSELHTNTLVRWSDQQIHWVEGFLQGLQQQVQDATPLIRPLLQTPTAVEVLVPGQSWETGFLQLQLQLTFSADTLYLPVVPLSAPLDQPTVLETIVKCIEGGSWDSRGTRSLQPGADRPVATPQPEDSTIQSPPAIAAMPIAPGAGQNPPPNPDRDPGPAPNTAAPVPGNASPDRGNRDPIPNSTAQAGDSGATLGSTTGSAQRSSARSVDFTLELPQPQRAIAAVLAPPVPTVEVAEDTAATATDLFADLAEAPIGPPSPVTSTATAAATAPPRPQVPAATPSEVAPPIDPALATAPPTALSLFGETGDREGAKEQLVTEQLVTGQQATEQLATWSNTDGQTLSRDNLGRDSLGRDNLSRDSLSQDDRVVTTNNPELESLSLDGFGDLFGETPAWDAGTIEAQPAPASLAPNADPAARAIDPGVLSYPTATNFLDFLPSIADPSPVSTPAEPAESAAPAESPASPAAPDTTQSRTPDRDILDSATPDRDTPDLDTPGTTASDPEPPNLTLEQVSDLFPIWQDTAAANASPIESEPAASSSGDDFLASLFAPDSPPPSSADPLASPSEAGNAPAETDDPPIAPPETAAAPAANPVPAALADNTLADTVLEVVPVEAATGDLTDFFRATGALSLEDLHLDLKSAHPPLPRPSLIHKQLRQAHAQNWGLEFGEQAGENSTDAEKILPSLVQLACETLDPPLKTQTLVDWGFLPAESNLEGLALQLLWQLIHHSYPLTCLLSGVPGQILQPQWGWENGMIYLVPLLRLQSEDLCLDLDLTSGSPVQVETLLIAPDILLQTNTPEWPQVRETVAQFQEELQQKLQHIIPESYLLFQGLAVRFQTRKQQWRLGQLQLKLELSFQGRWPQQTR